jgi:hypothetical protein
MSHKFFFDNIEFSSSLLTEQYVRKWTDINTNKIIYKFTNNSLNVDDILYSFRYYNLLSDTYKNEILDTKLPQNIELFLYWKVNDRISYENMDFIGNTYHDLFKDYLEDYDIKYIDIISPNRIMIEYNR